MGLSPTHSLMSAGDVDTYGASDQAGRGMRRVDRMLRGPPINQNARGILKALQRLRCFGADRISAVRSRSKGRHLRRFITIIYGSNRGRLSRSDGHNLIETVHDRPFHRNRRSKRSDGYTQNCYKKACSSTFVSIRVESQAN